MQRYSQASQSISPSFQLNHCDFVGRLDKSKASFPFATYISCVLPLYILVLWLLKSTKQRLTPISVSAQAKPDRSIFLKDETWLKLLPALHAQELNCYHQPHTAVLVWPFIV